MTRAAWTSLAAGARPSKRKTLTPGSSEDRHAAAFVAAFRQQHPRHATQLIHISNEGGITADIRKRFAHAAKRRRQGVLPGVADYFLAVPVANIHGLWLELKSPTGTLKPEQAAFLHLMIGCGYAAATAWGWAAALDVANKYLRDDAGVRCVYGASEAAGVVPLSKLTMGGRPRAVRLNSGPAPLSQKSEPGL